MTFVVADQKQKKQDGQRRESGQPARGQTAGESTNATWTALAFGGDPRLTSGAADEPSLGLPLAGRPELERAFSADLSDVRVHVAPETTRPRATEAVTMGRDIYLARPMPPDAPGSRTMLAHEVAHVVQQRSGGATAAAGTGDGTLEAEAGRAAADVAAGRSAAVHGAARWGAPQNFTTKEGDQLPDPIIVDWSERFQITFGTRTTGYGDVKIQYKFRYLGSFAGEPGDLDFVIERDPGGPWVMGTPHTRRINATITKYGSDAITVDVYGDGTVIHYLWHTVSWSAHSNAEQHQLELVENNDVVQRRTLTTINTKGVALRPESGVVGTVAPPVFKPDPDRGPQLPTGMLLDMIVARMNAMNMPITVATWVLRMKLAEDMNAATQVGDDEGVARNARRLLDLLTYLGPIFVTLEEMEKPDQYLGDLGPVVYDEVHRITHLYIAAMLEAYSPPGETPSLAAADQAMASFPDWVKFLYLRDDRGVKSLIAQIPGLVTELRAARERNHNRWGPSATPAADELVGLNFQDRGKELEQARGSVEMSWREERENILDSIQSLYTKVQHLVGLLTAMIWHEQLAAIRSELSGSVINSAMEATFWGERTDRAAKYVHQLQMIVYRLSGLKIVYGSGYNLTDKSDKELVDDALKELAELGNSAQFTSDLDDFATRIKWVDRIAFLGKLALIIAAAALTGGTAGSLAFAGLRAAGAGVALATAGELVIGGLVFTAVSREGQQLMFGKAEGNFFVDWFWNTVTLGVLKAANYGFTKAFKLTGLDPNVAKVRFGLGRTVTSMVSLHGVAEVHHLAAKHELMSWDERVDAFIQNAALMVGLEAGRFITAPLEARLTATLISKLKIDVKLAARINGLAAQRKPLIARLEALSRGELPADKIDTTLKDIEKLWAEELRLVNDGFNRKILTEQELGTALSAYNAHIAGMQLRLSQLGIEAPMPGGTTFRPIQPGFVAFKPEGRAAIEKHYTPDPADPTTAGKSLKESAEIPGALEGRLPNGALTIYIPEGSVPKGMPKAATVIAARDAAVLAAKADAKAAAGFARLNEGLKGTGPTAKGFNQKNVDAILGSVPIELIPEFLRAMADPGFTQRIGVSFYTEVLSRPTTVEFARAYGAAAVIKIWQNYSASAFDAMLGRAQTALETAETPAARQELLENLLKSNKASLDKLLDTFKAKPPRELPVSKATLGVNPKSTEWLKLRNDAADFAKAHNATWIQQDTLNMMADLLQIHSKAMLGKYSKWVGHQDAVENLLNRFDALAEKVAQADPAGLTGPWAKTIGNWRNSLRGAIGEAVGRPAGTVKFKGGLLGGKAVPQSTPGATIPDYHQDVGGIVEWVNIKSDLLTPGLPGSRSGTYAEGVARARAYRKAADTEAANLPAGGKYSVQFLRDPLRARDTSAGQRTMQEMLDLLFSDGSPIYRVKFGDRPWISRDAHRAGGSK